MKQLIDSKEVTKKAISVTQDHFHKEEDIDDYMRKRIATDWIKWRSASKALCETNTQQVKLDILQKSYETNHALQFWVLDCEKACRQIKCCWDEDAQVDNGKTRNYKIRN